MICGGQIDAACPDLPGRYCHRAGLTDRLSGLRTAQPFPTTGSVGRTVCTSAAV